MPTHPQTLAFGCRTAFAELGAEHIWGANLHRGLLRQVELAVLRVLEGIKRALPVLFITVTALDAGLFDYCWHVGFSLVRWPTDTTERPKCAVYLRWAFVSEAGSWAGIIPPPVFGSWGSVACQVFAASGRLHGGRSPTEELRAISLAGAAALEGD